MTKSSPPSSSSRFNPKPTTFLPTLFDSHRPPMEKEPLLPYHSPRRKLSSIKTLLSLPEDDALNLPLTPSELKDRLIFGPSSSPTNPSQLLDALNLPGTSSFLEPLAPDTHLQKQPSIFFNPNFTTRRTNLHRSRTAPAISVPNRSPADVRGPPRPKSATQSIVTQACALLAMYLSLGVLIYWFNRDDFAAAETHPAVDALYFCIVTMCTIGYGDITPKTSSTKLFAVMFVLIGFGFVDILLSGMVSYVLDLQENYLLRAVNGGWHKDSAGRYIIDVKKGRMRIRMKVALALGVVVVCIGVGVCVLHFVEKLGWLDSLYLSVMSVTTVGYGDWAFTSMEGRLFVSMWLLVSTLAVARAFLYLAEARVDRRNRRMAKWVLGQEMTIAQFMAADLDNNGCVSKSEYVIYKLKEMGKVSDKDIMQISSTFDRLDTGNCGKITLADLMEQHHMV